MALKEGLAAWIFQRKEDKHVLNYKCSWCELPRWCHRGGLRPADRSLPAYVPTVLSVPQQLARFKYVCALQDLCEKEERLPFYFILDVFTDDLRFCLEINWNPVISAGTVHEPYHESCINKQLKQANSDLISNELAVPTYFDGRRKARK